MTKRYFAVAAGRVQGVGFRFFVQMNAGDMAITGWVRNMDDRTVEMELQGEEEALERLIKKIKRGNLFIRVRDFSLVEKSLVENEINFIMK